MTTLRTLTLHQPWATLVALGVKTIETRSWQTRYRGRVAIHAAARPARTAPGPWRIHSNGRAMWNYARPHDPVVPLPLGAIVATATLVDIVPMIEASRITTSAAALVLDFPHDGDLPHQQGGHWLIGPNNLTHGRPTRVDDQRHYGDYAPGRYAWLLTDIEPCDPIPAKGKQGLWTWDGEAQHDP